MSQDLSGNEAGLTIPQEKPVGLYLLQVLRRRKWRILAGVMAGLLLGALYCVLAGPWYESRAQLLVIQKRLETSPLSGPNQGQTNDGDHLATHMLVIVSPQVVERAIRKSGLDSLASLGQEDGLEKVKHWLGQLISGDAPKGGNEDRLTRKIIDSLQVTSDSQKPGINPSKDILTISFRGKTPGDCDKVLNALIASYQEFWNARYRNVNAETLDLINRARVVLQKDLDAKEADYRNFRHKAPLLIKNKEGRTIPQERLFGIDAKRSLLRMRQQKIQATLAGIEKASRANSGYAEMMRILSGSLPPRKSPVYPLFSDQDGWTATRSPQAILEEELLTLRLQEGTLLEKYGLNHPAVQPIRKRIEIVCRLLAPASSSSSKGVPQVTTDEDYINLKVQLLKQEFVANQQTEESLTDLFRGEQAEVRSALNHELEDEAHRQSIERSKFLYDSLMKRLQELNSVRDYGGYSIEVLAAPKPGELVRRKYVLVLGFALFGGLLVGVAWGMRGELSAKSLQTPNQICQMLGLPLLGHIPARSARGKAVPRTSDNGEKERLALALAEPNSPYSEAYRALRTALYFSKYAQGRQTIQFTSPDPGDGKTSVAANLAIAIAETGQRVIVIDADLWRPRLHEIFGISGQQGLTDVLAGQAKADEVIQASGLAGLSILPCGPLPPNPAELLTSPRLKELLESLRPHYDFIFIDTPPLLTKTDPLAVAPRVDGVLLTVRLSKGGSLRAKRATERLETVGAKVLGLVVNGMRYRSTFEEYS